MTTETVTDVKSMLKFDPLQFAEDVTGTSYKDDEATGLLGLGIAMKHNQMKNSLLLEMGDSTLSNDLARYIGIIESMGFKLALELPFTDEGYKHSCGHNEKYFIFIHPEKGILLDFDTYGGDRVNGGKFHYCWREKEGVKTPYGVLSNTSWESESEPNWRRSYGKGSPTDAYVAGSHDCREAIRHHVLQLEEYGDFLSPWPKWNNESPRFLWLLHYIDERTEGYEYKEITRQRIEMLPQWARDIINL